MERILAFDPGEVWCGLAAFSINRKKNELFAETRVLNLRERTFKVAVDECTFVGLPATVVCEDYRVRPVGHQRFTSGMTLQLIGAIRYTTEAHGCRLHTIPPGNAEKEVPEIVGDFFGRWRATHPTPHAAEWNHAFSAWRVLLRHLMKTDVALLMRLRDVRVQATFTTTARWLPSVSKAASDLLAPAGRWSLAP